MLERIRGDEAARLFLAHLGLGRSAAGYGFLRDLAAGFARLPYENISKIIKSAETDGPLQSMRLPSEVAVDHVERGFGGTCFSLTFFLERMLKSLGFDACKVMADMNSGPNVHCLVVVNEGGSQYMIDPGYALYRVIGLPQASGPESSPRASRRVACPHAVVEIVSEGSGSYSLWTDDATGRKRRYGFRNRPVADEDFEGYWEASFGKATLNNICLTRMTDQGHLYLRKDFFKLSSRDSVDKHRIAGGVERLIRDEFGIAEEWTARAREILKERRDLKAPEDGGRT